MNGFDVGTVLTIRTTSTSRDYTVTSSNGHRTELVGRRGARRVLVGVPQSDEWSIIEECMDRPRSRPCWVESFMLPTSDELPIAPEDDYCSEGEPAAVVAESPLHSSGYEAGYAACFRGEPWAEHDDPDWNAGYAAAMSHDPDESPGLKYDDGKPQLGRVPVEAMEAIARVMAYGAEKYGEDNWRKVRPAVRYIDAALRHIGKHMAGEDLDDESGVLQHLDQALTNIAFVVALRDDGVDTRGR